MLRRAVYVTSGTTELRVLVGALSAAFMATLLAVACAPPQQPDGEEGGSNRIVVENARPGNPPSEWDLEGAGDASIEGFATRLSVAPGETVGIKVRTDAADWSYGVYRLGYYQGMGARRLAADRRPIAALPQQQPECLDEGETGLVDCGNWSLSAEWQVPADVVSGIYLLKLTRHDTGGSNHVVVVVRDDANDSDLVFQTSDTTWQAYNDWANSLYRGSYKGRQQRARKVSYNRPFWTRNWPRDWLFNAEVPMVRWLEANGYDVSYITAADTDRDGERLLRHRVFLSVGHDEYWSLQQRRNVEKARDSGVHLAFFSGNEMFWKTRWEASIDGSATPYRTLVCYKETHDNARTDPSGEWTGTWRDPRFSPPADGGEPESLLTGTIGLVMGGEEGRHDAIQVPAEFGRLRFWRHTAAASLEAGEVLELPTGTLGHEWDSPGRGAERPPGLIELSHATLDVTPNRLLDFGNVAGSGEATHALTLYRHASGALVFGAGTIQWSWGLDDYHDRQSVPTHRAMQQATVNLLADMGVEPGTLQPGLIHSHATSDETAPETTLGPAPQRTAAGAVTVTGTSHDAEGVVAAVEISVDGGAVWELANGREEWSYTFEPTAQPVELRVRAVDDSGNLESPPVRLTIGP